MTTVTQVGRRWPAIAVGTAIVALGAAAAIAAAAIALASPDARPRTEVEIVVRYSRFEPAQIVVPAGVPVTIRLVNEDPIDHEWIVGDDAVHAVHRVGTEPLHSGRPTEVVLPALTTATTVVTFDAPGELAFICHLPGHEAYGMAGSVRVVGS